MDTKEEHRDGSYPKFPKDRIDAGSSFNDLKIKTNKETITFLLVINLIATLVLLMFEIKNN